MKIRLLRCLATASVASFAIFANTARAQTAPAPANPPPATAKKVPTTAEVTATAAESEQVVTLTPFEVSASADTGYSSSTTLAGNRLNTDLRDIGNAVTVITSQFMKDIGATNNETLLQYTIGTEVGNIQGNFAGVGDSASLNESGRFANPNQNTRVRGLTSADNTRDFFLTDIPWDGYAVDRIELQRGANSILFGQGSPAGIINTGTKQATFKNTNEVEARFGSFGTFRSSLDLYRVLRKRELAVRILGLYNDEKFQQDPAAAHAVQHFDFTMREVPPLRQLGEPPLHRLGDVAPAGVDLADRLHQLVARHALLQVTVGARLNRLLDVFIQLGCREHQHAHVRPGGAQRAQGLQPAHPGHAHIHQHDIGGIGPVFFDRLLAVLRLGHDGEVVVEAQHGGQAHPHHRMVIHEQDTDTSRNNHGPLYPARRIGAIALTSDTPALAHAGTSCDEKACPERPSPSPSPSSGSWAPPACVPRSHPRTC